MTSAIRRIVNRSAEGEGACEEAYLTKVGVYMGGGAVRHRVGAITSMLRGEVHGVRRLLGSRRLYTGYAFTHAVQVQSVLEENALMVPFVVHWRNETPEPVMYPANTQEQAVALAIQAREDRTKSLDGWSSGREGLLKQNDGTERDVLLIEAWVPGLTEHLVLFHYYSPRPFVLVGGFVYKNNPQFKRSPEETKLFAHHFRRGISSHPFGDDCLKIVAKTVDRWPTATGQNH